MCAEANGAVAGPGEAAGACRQPQAASGADTTLQYAQLLDSQARPRVQTESSAQLEAREAVQQRRPQKEDRETDERFEWNRSDEIAHYLDHCHTTGRRLYTAREYGQAVAWFSHAIAAAESAGDDSRAQMATNGAVEPTASAVDTIASAVEPTASAVEPIAAAVDTIAAAVEPIASAVEPIAAAVEPIAAAVEPIAAAVDTIASVVDTIASVVEPIAAVVSPVRSTGRTAWRSESCAFVIIDSSLSDSAKVSPSVSSKDSFVDSPLSVSAKVSSSPSPNGYFDDMATMLSNRAAALLRLGRYSAAAVDSERAIRLDPHHIGKVSPHFAPELSHPAFPSCHRHGLSNSTFGFLQFDEQSAPPWIERLAPSRTERTRGHNGSGGREGDWRSRRRGCALESRQTWRERARPTLRWRELRWRELRWREESSALR